MRFVIRKKEKKTLNLGYSTGIKTKTKKQRQLNYENRAGLRSNIIIHTLHFRSLTLNN